MGLARSVAATVDLAQTVYVQTSWYRAPEVILELGYDERVDVWSVGCIMGELILQEILLPGFDSVDQIRRIMQLRGYPPQAFVDRIRLPAIRTFLEPFAQQVGQIIVHPDPLARQTLEALLDYERPSAADALELPYFQYEGGHNPALEPVYGVQIETVFEGENIETQFEAEQDVDYWHTRLVQLIDGMWPSDRFAHVKPAV
eukprot:m.374327 g.374327  ORF g.374327 m.374327 type:complete len:201 (-) comp56162_c0_seq3:73-675(-)